MRTKGELLDELRSLLGRVFGAAKVAGHDARVARARGYADGFMKALLDAGIASEAEVLAVVQEQRQNAHGPALGDLDLESGIEAA